MTEFSELLRSAIREQLAEGGDDLLGLASIEAMTLGNPEFERVFAEETAPEQVRLDLHLEGAGVIRNSTRADMFGRFISTLERTVDATAHHLAGRGRRLPELLVTGAMPGSVRVVVQVPDAPKPRRVGATEAMVSSTSVLSQAVRTVTGVLVAAAADDSPDSDTLIASTERMPKSAKISLASLAKTIDQADWQIRGNIAQRHQHLEEFRLDHRGARRLVSALKAEVSEPERVSVIGRLDGVRYSLATAWLTPNEGTRTVAITVPSAALLDEAAALAAAHKLVRAYLDVYREQASDGSTLRTSRALVGLTEETEDDGPEQMIAF